MMNTPWLSFYDNVPKHINYPNTSMFELVQNTAKAFPNFIAYEFMGKTTTYAEFINEVNQCAKALKAIGINEGDRITICLPNVPQAVIFFYAVNLIGAISNMIHPLSSEGEIQFYLNNSNSKAAITLDIFYDKFENIRGNTVLKYLIITSIKDKLGIINTIGYNLSKGCKIKDVSRKADTILWKDFLKKGKKYNLGYTVIKKDKIRQLYFIVVVQQVLLKAFFLLI
jgi:long-chain acyl-CoA synthetase